MRQREAWAERRLTHSPPPTTCYHRRRGAAVAAPTSTAVSTATAMAHAVNASPRNQLNGHTAGPPPPPSESAKTVIEAVRAGNYLSVTAKKKRNPAV
jgi:hypothetical protein